MDEDGLCAGVYVLFFVGGNTFINVLKLVCMKN